MNGISFLSEMHRTAKTLLSHHGKLQILRYGEAVEDFSPMREFIYVCQGALKLELQDPAKEYLGDRAVRVTRLGQHQFLNPKKLRKELSGGLQSYRIGRAVSEDSLTVVLTFPADVSATFLEDPQSYWSRHFEELFQTAFGQLYLTSKQVRKQISDLCELEMIRPNTVLLEEDQLATHLVILLSGSLDLRKQLYLPREEGDKSATSKLVQTLT